MPRVDFSQLPDDARAWVFASDRRLSADEGRRLLAVTDEFLAHWNAHGEPLTCAREWRDDRFLIIGVDQRTAGASGCSIDGLFRVFGTLERELNASLRGAGRVYWRDASGDVASATRLQFRERAASGEIGGETPVFDTSLTSVGDIRARFEMPASRSWHAQLLAQRA